jgi:manganese/zinc/iron transport system substrate-binding protein
MEKRIMTKMGLKTLWVVCALALSTTAVKGEERPRILATVGMVTDIVREVAGEAAEVEGMLGAGVDPHLYKPTRGDLVRIGAADILIYNGLKLEAQLAEVMERQGKRGVPVLAVAEAVLASGKVEAEPGEYGADPHLWMSVPAWKQAVREVASFLSEVDAERAEVYTANAAAYLKELEALHAYALEAVATVPERNRVLVTAHDAFGYFGRAYGVEVRGIQGISTESEAGLRDVEALLSFIIERGLPAIFIESSVSDKNVRALMEGAQAQDHALHIGGTLFSDAMGPEGSYEGTYAGMMDHNVTTIVRALGGQVPEKGMHGRLAE